MTSWQAYVATWITRHRLKPALANARSIDEVRQLLRPPVFKVPRGVKVSAGQVGGVPGEWIEAAGNSAGTLLYLHGGGYIACSPETHRAITVGYAMHGFRVFAPEYRLAPENPFPAALEDATAVFRALLEQGVPSERLVVSGDSAGGGLTLALMISLRDAAVPLPAAAVLFSPWTDLAGTGDSLTTNDRRCAMFFAANMHKAAHHYLGTTDPQNPLVSPVYANLAGLPPMLIHVGADELLLDDSVRLAARARAAGVEVEIKIWPVVAHVWQLTQDKVPEGRRSLREATAFLQAALQTATEVRTPAAS